MTAATAGSPARPPAAGSDESLSADADLAAAATSPAVSHEDSTAVIVVNARLDAAAGRALVAAATAALATAPARLDIDLRALDSFTDEGAAALLACRSLGARLPEGLHYRTGRGPGRDALLTAYRDADVGLEAE